MKKLMLMTAVILGMGTTLIAQTTPATPTTPNAPETRMRHQSGEKGDDKNNRGDGGGYRAADPATRAAKMANRIKETCGLDDATTQKVTQICLARDQKVDEIQTGTLSNQDKNKALMDNKNNFESQLKAILTADQFATFTSMKKGRKGDRKDDNKN